jgi:predicted lipid-binding transport protein (Tim44 family)
MSKKPESEKNLPSVSKQTAGGITGAVIGGMVAGPMGALAGGIAGALVGDSSAKGNEPIQKTIETIRSTGMRGARAIKAARNRNKLSRSAKEPTKGSAATTAASKPALAKQKRKAKPAVRKVSNAAKSKVASKPKAKSTPKRAKKKA